MLIVVKSDMQFESAEPRTYPALISVYAVIALINR
jgi:hypothetical protein